MTEVVVARAAAVPVDEYIDLLERSTLARRRPVDDPALIEAALDHSSLIITGRTPHGVLVGAARAITDFHLHCYLADLAVDASLQRQGLGLRLQKELVGHLGPRCKLKLSAAPAASEYYPRIGYERNTRAWELPPGTPLG
ncbi:GNAT family N-acetyltransferase [Demequina sediminicola]|uniref:GNAT family N-acetyltransferase n=1 Tax=Demequina sediminicola TaxID=1095026 RepID=UPI000782CE6E|nr:GNAT family N-acetyltransferase [Demequina sediminicola]